MAKTTKAPSGVPPAKKIEAAYDWGQEQITGVENVSTEDLGIPFLIILQPKSPECDKSHSDYKAKKIEGAEAGDIVNTLTRKILHKCEGEPMVFVPCTYQKLYPEWRPRNEGGGFVKHHKSSDILSQTEKDEETGRDVLPSGNNIVTTAYFFGYVINKEGENEPCVISMSSTQLKASRAWLNIALGHKVQSSSAGGLITPPLFSHKYHLSSIGQSNSKGSWFGWAVESGEMITDKNLIEFGRNSAKTMGLGTNRPQIAAPAGDKDVPI